MCWRDQVLLVRGEGKEAGRYELIAATSFFLVHVAMHWTSKPLQGLYSLPESLQFSMTRIFNLTSAVLVSFLLLQDSREKKWRIQAVGSSPGSFESRLALPAAWRGLRDEELSAASGVPGGVFCHISGFIGGNATLEGALAMAAKAVEAAA